LISDVYTVEKRSKIQGRLASLGGIGRIAGVWIGGLLYDGLGHKYPGWGFYEGSIFIVATAAMFLSTLPMLFVPEGGVKSNSSNSDGIDDISDNQALKGVFTFFLTAMMFINFGRNSIVLTQPQYLMLKSGLAVSSSVLGYIVNTQSVAMIFCGLVVGGLANLLGTGRALLTGTLSAVASILLMAISTDLKLIYLSYFLRGLSEVIIMATSYTFASTLIPAQKRGRKFALYNATFFLSWGLAGTLITGPLVDLLIKNGQVEAIAYRISFYTAAALTMVGFGLLTYLLYLILPKRQTRFHKTD
jgi:MFS family permease